jgi:death-on-curing protein
MPLPPAAGAEKDMFPDRFTKAAALMKSIIQRHPFVDGNKRTGTASAIYLLRGHGYRLIDLTNTDLVDLALSVAAHRMGVEELGAWFDDQAESL